MLAVNPKYNVFVHSLDLEWAKRNGTHSNRKYDGHKFFVYVNNVINCDYK